MNTGKLMIADTTSSAELIAQRAQELGLTVQLCGDGSQVIDQLQQFRPDVLVLDLCMPGRDGLTILSDLQQLDPRPACLITTGFLSSYVENTLTDLGVDYLMRRPYHHEAIMDRIVDLLEIRDSSPITIPLRKTEFSDRLLALGFSPKRRGFHYLNTALEMYHSDTQISMTKELYPAVAKQFDTSASSVERAIRTVIQDTWSHSDFKTWRLYFHSAPSGFVPRPTNSEFFSVLSRQPVPTAASM